MLFNISQDFDSFDVSCLSCLHVGDSVYVIDQYNLYDIYKCKIDRINNDIINVSYTDIDNEPESVPIKRILPDTPKNKTIYITQENIRSQRNRIYSDIKETNNKSLLSIILPPLFVNLY